MEFLRKTSLFILFLTFFNLLYAYPQSPPDTLWTRTFGGTLSDRAYSVELTSDGGFIVSGAKQLGNYSDIWLLKTNSNGDTLWTKLFGAGTSYAVKQTTDGGYILTGAGVHNGSDVILIKTDEYGNTLWKKFIGGNGTDICHSIQQTSDGGYILAGLTNPNPSTSGDDNVLLIKTNAIGDTLWTRSFGGIYDEIGFSVLQTTDGGYLVVGGTNSFSFNHTADVYLIKTNTSGSILWDKVIPIVEHDHDLGYSVQQTMDGGFIVAGTVFQPSRVLLIKLDYNGDTLWTKQIQVHAYNVLDKGYSIKQTSDGGYIITGSSYNHYQNSADAFLMKTNADGDKVWIKIFEGDQEDIGYSVQQSSDGGYIIAGETNSFGAGDADVWLIKTNPDISSIAQNYSNLPLEYSLFQNYPNPFNPVTSLQYAISSRQFVTLKVYDLLGREIATLVNEEKPAGEYEVEFDGANLPSGIYFYQLQAGQYLETRKMVLIK